ncbi:hypothetical protein BAUCODRAFT_354810 [Baudoinia panamericana UAMH 10762]|uniref:BED-type domain-containing protein n=1 Tax=Baudoinia panamericana (strain UAMH 10762) TaxID=717646 RepID=M2MSQ1_BAUPA|nr:uncharacterized protein BAUCODRAFT_354810 [Baudoinia panamericana UAMH 10762]EMC99906.1 hypothetical protein BAUCODRAFT_354810 [Baudoinia panamericana UAMH 10762]
MTKKKRPAVPSLEELLERPWCYYCERDFDDIAILRQHQKAKHCRCDRCGRRLDTVGGLQVHVTQVHKESITEVENALPHRKDPSIEIFGMEGIPDELKQAHIQRVTEGYYARYPAGGTGAKKDSDDHVIKKAKTETPEEMKKRLAEFRAKRAEEKKLGLPRGSLTDSPRPQSTDSMGLDKASTTPALDARGSGMWSEGETATAMQPSEGHPYFMDPRGSTPPAFDNPAAGTRSNGAHQPHNAFFQPDPNQVFHQNGVPAWMGPDGSATANQDRHPPPGYYTPANANIQPLYKEYNEPPNQNLIVRRGPPPTTLFNADTRTRTPAQTTVPDSNSPPSARPNLPPSVSSLPPVPGLPQRPAVNPPNLSKGEMQYMHQGGMPLNQARFSTDYTPAIKRELSNPSKSAFMPDSTSRAVFDASLEDMISEQAESAKHKREGPGNKRQPEVLTKSEPDEPSKSEPDVLSKSEPDGLPERKVTHREELPTKPSPGFKRVIDNAGGQIDSAARSRPYYRPHYRDIPVDDGTHKKSTASKRVKSRLLCDDARNVGLEEEIAKRPKYCFDRLAHERTEFVLGDISGAVTAETEDVVRDPQDTHP